MIAFDACPRRVALAALAVAFGLSARPPSVMAEPTHDPDEELESVGPTLPQSAPSGNDGRDEPVPVEGDHQQKQSTSTSSAPNKAIENPKLPDIPGSKGEQPTALPSGADKSGVTSKSISVPKGSGTIQGMGESFSAQLSTGIATFSVPLSLPAARGGAQPSLGLSYSSSGGFGIAGVGWSIGVPFIARQTDRGVPRYDDQSGWHANQDRFVFNGGQELVPICVVASGGACTGAQAEEEMPAWAVGWQYFRPRVEGSFLRFFWSPNQKTWRVQDKSGVTMELGAPLDGSLYVQALERNPDKPSEIYRWHLVRQYDTWGEANPASGNPTPFNLTVFRYFQDGGTAYLSDIFDTPPAANATSAPLSDYAHHTRLVYASRPDPTHSYRSGWRMDQALRLTRVDVTSKTHNASVQGARRQVRRYHLDYDPASHVSLLNKVQVEGRCAGAEANAPAEDAAGLLADSTSCARLPAMRFSYSHVTPFTTTGATGIADLVGYEGFDERLIDVASSPPHAVDEEHADLFDVNADSLPDVLVTAAGVYGAGHGVFFNGASGKANFFGAVTSVPVAGVLGADSSTITLKNLNVAPLDLDGDGITDLLHMPKVQTYAVYGPVQSAGTWVWQGRTITTADGLSPKIDLGKDGLDTQVMDVDFDGLVDVVITTGTEVQTYFSLGRYPGGDGRFGTAAWTSATTATLSTEPARTCVPWAGTPVRFSDSDVKTADMNGDGITDIVRVRKGDVRYWPGRGNGLWGSGKRDDCPSGTFGANRHVAMDSSPQYTDIQGQSLRLDDVNGDGLTDLVQVRFDEVDVWLNVDGKGWTPRHIIDNTPPSPSYANRVRLVDVNGSGTRDILWGDAGSYRYMDLAGGSRPFVLTKVENGLGKTTSLGYSTSAQEMLNAEKAGTPWTTRMPTSVHVVKQVVETTNLALTGTGPLSQVTEYSYRDPVYEGRQREFRGFRSASAKRIGDANSPTDITDSTFLLGECADESAANGTDECAIDQRWRDNPREALKGLPVVTEKRNEDGFYLSTDISRYRLRRLYLGLDGREVRQAFKSLEDKYAYDVADFVAATTDVTPTTVEVELSPPAGPDPALAAKTSVKLRSTAGRVRIQTESTVDVFGNQLTGVARGCIEGCSPVDEVITTTTTPGRPADDPTGWLWRTVSSSASGSLYFLGLLRETTNVYSSKGALTQTRLRLLNTLSLDRFHAGGASVAPAPSDASFDGAITNSNQYDDFGNLTRESGPNGRCRDVGYEDGYEQLATLETIYLAGCDSTSPPPLQTGAAYDAGFGLVASVVDVQNQPTLVSYDPFGRLARIERPHPATAEASSPLPSVKVEYLLPPDLGPDAHYSVIHSETHDGSGLTDQEYLESWSYVDGMGRTLLTLTEADTNAGDDGGWIATGQVAFDAKGAIARKYLDSFYNGSAKAFPLGATTTTPFATQAYDAFGRSILSTDLDGTPTLRSYYHALSTDLWDGADFEVSSPHNGTYATEQKDGHGRTRLTVERFRESGVMQERKTTTEFLPTGEPLEIKRKLVSSGAEVVRWMRYDSLGRMVLNVEPNTSSGFTTDHTSLPGTLKAWRYAYNDSGDLVGTSDAHGCGVNFAYDGAGRLLYEDYSPCETHHQAYSSPDLGTRTGIEVLYHYDTEPSDAPAALGFGSSPDAFVKGRLVAVYDRASVTMTRFDGRGRAAKIGTRIAKPGVPEDSIATRYTDRWYYRDFVFDAADRERAATTGSTVSQLQGAQETTFTNSTSAVTTTYSARGTVKAVGGSFNPLIQSANRSADGLLNQIAYGDGASTRTDFTYDDRRRLSNVTTSRNTPNLWNSPPSDYLPAPTPGTVSTFQLILQDESFDYDVVSNPTRITDWRTHTEWPADAKPVTRELQYDDLYRVKQIDYQYQGGSTWKSPYDAENSGTPSLQDPRRAKPSPHVSFDYRVAWQTFSYDWMGNTSATDDDADGFYDRSIGTITNDTASTKPYQLKAADNLATSSTRKGALEARYDATGNLTRLQVERFGPCLPNGAKCRQVFAYEWDEVGRLARARRWDLTSLPLITDPLPSGIPDVELRYCYDAGDQRVIKTAEDPEGNERHTLYVFETLELRRAAFATGDYELTSWTEVPYLYAHGVRLARVAWEETDVPMIGTSQLHVFFELGDHLGSTSVVLDQKTGELVERATTQAYGAAESDYRPERWKGFREDYRFTGKEEDVEVGLQYFGKRYYAPLLNRWVSADPLAVHGPGEADFNLYAYAYGSVLKFVDELGLDVTLIVAAQKTAKSRSNDAQRAREKGVSVRKIVADRVADDRNFANRATALQQRLEKKGWKDVIVEKPDTGQKLLDQMQSASSKAPIKNLVAYGHSTNVSVIMKENAGLFRNRGDMSDPKAGAAFLKDLKARMEAGDIKFSKDATIVLLGCNCGGNFGKKGEPFSLAAELAKATGARVIASVGKSDQAKASGDGREYSNGGWFAFDKQSPEGRRLEGEGCSNGSCQTMQPEKHIKKH